jgi:hypothetical protein
MVLVQTPLLWSFWPPPIQLTKLLYHISCRSQIPETKIWYFSTLCQLLYDFFPNWLMKKSQERVGAFALPLGLLLQFSKWICTPCTHHSLLHLQSDPWLLLLFCLSISLSLCNNKTWLFQVGHKCSIAFLKYLKLKGKYQVSSSQSIPPSGWCLVLLVTPSVC